jgi:tRNA splicing ligase
LKLCNGDDETAASWPADLTPEKLIEILRSEIEITKTRAAEAEVLSEVNYTTVMAEIEDEIYEQHTLEYDEKLAAYNYYQTNPELKQAIRELKATQRSLLKKSLW